ncbi:methyltransferase domain-containing protein, partial [bacterium]|nr:methyltransferase domain-containing protein [bacterium]
MTQPRIPFRTTALALLLACACAARAEDALARQILDAAGVRGGLILHVGSGDGALTASLRANEHTLVLGLDADAAKVAQARERIQKLGIYGPVSVAQFDGTRLPLADNLANLVVAEALGGVTLSEAMRVLAPGGILTVRQGGRWTKSVKPRPANVDEWTHYLHDASGNAVAHDQVVGPPRSVQWIADPHHTRSHEHTPSISALVSAGGRIFYIADEAPVASLRRTPQWRLVARDAHNGILLWKLPFNPWFPHIVNWCSSPPSLQRRLIATRDRVYVTLGLHAPLTAIDAATGETVRVYEKTRGTEEALFHKGALLLLVRNVTDARIAELAEWSRLVKQDKSPVYKRESAEPLVKRFRSLDTKTPSAIRALDANTGRVL